ncbi:Protein BOI2 like protein [Verticillium longisporum]|nr:Protein BOI2 like protein [Verticillium longisporum]
MAARPPNEGHPKPDVGDTLLVIHDFLARSSDELSLVKGDRVELIERDDEFGDGWFLGKHLANGNSGLFPEVYTRPAPKIQHANAPLNHVPSAKAVESPAEPSQNIGSSNTVDPAQSALVPATPPVASPSSTDAATPITLPLNAAKKDDVPSQPQPSISGPSFGSLNSLEAGPDSHVLHETLNVIDEHITDLRSPPSSGGLRAATNDSGSEYSTQLDHRLSYIQGEETDEEEEGAHSRLEVEAWSPDQVAEHLFTAGVEKHHCEVFRDQEITGDVLLGMDQSSLFIKAFDLGSVGRRLKTWQKIKALQDECNGQGIATKRTTQTYGSDAGSDGRRTRSRTSTMTNSMHRLPPGDDRTMSIQTRRLSITQTPRMEAAGLVSPISSTKQPSFDRNWSLGNAFSSPRPLSSAGLQDAMHQSGLNVQETAPDLDRGYFSGNEVDGRRRNVLRKRDSGAHSKKNSYADEQRVRSATAISRHSRYGSIDAPREGAPSAAAQKYYGLQSGPHKRATSTSTTRSIPRVPSIREAPSPVVTKLDSASRDLPVVSGSPASRHNVNSDWLASLVNKPTVKIGGLRATSDISSGERARITSPVDTTVKDSPLPSPAPTGSSTPSAGPSFDLDSPGNGKMSPSTTTTAASKSSRRKGKKETSAYQRGLQKIGPKEAMKDADYSGWMKKKSSNLMTTWKPRLFVLKGRRLAYYYSEDDQQEKGLIDISFHRVLPADNEKLTGLHATLTGAGSAAAPAASTLAQPEVALDKGDDSMFIFKLVPPRTGLTRAVNFTKPTVHYFAVPNLQQGRLWMAALVKATIDRDDTQPITTTYQQKTISLAKARAMRHRPPALMNLDETPEEDKKNVGGSNKDANLLGIHFGETDSGVSGLEKPGPAKVESANAQKLFFDAESSAAPPPQSA